MVIISSWNFVRVPKAWLWAHEQSFSSKFSSQVLFQQHTNFERIFWRARETIVKQPPGVVQGPLSIYDWAWSQLLKNDNAAFKAKQHCHWWRGLGQCHEVIQCSVDSLKDALLWQDSKEENIIHYGTWSWMTIFELNCFQETWKHTDL